MTQTHIRETIRIMTINWERNSKVKNLVDKGKIRIENVIPRTTTDNFPPETATVRMQGMNKKVPFITIHIKGKGNSKTFNSWGGTPQTYVHANTMRVNMGSDYYEEQHGVSGELDKDLSYMDVHNVVTKVRGDESMMNASDFKKKYNMTKKVLDLKHHIRISYPTLKKIVENRY